MLGTVPDVENILENKQNIDPQAVYILGWGDNKEKVSKIACQTVVSVIENNKARKCKECRHRFK